MQELIRKAYEVAGKSNCLDKHVGALLVRNGRVIAGGCNTTQCFGKCRKQNGEKCPAWHAEWVLLYNLKIMGKIILPTDYVLCTYEPCNECLSALAEAGVTNVVYVESKQGKTGMHNGVNLTKFGPNLFESDNLSTLAHKIDKFHKMIGWPKRYKTSEDQTKEAQILLLALYQEVGEVVDSLNWKPWRANYGVSVPKHHLTEELADVFFFWCSILECFGVSVKDMEIAIAEKLDKNYNRETEKRQ